MPDDEREIETTNREYEQVHPRHNGEARRDTSLDIHVGGNIRKYLPTLADLIDRLTIVQLKEVFLHEHRDEYVAERRLIEHDIDIVLHEKYVKDGFQLRSGAIHAIVMIMLSNRAIWESESKARAGGSDQDRLLKFTHSINGVRNTAKNVLSELAGERRDWKTDCYASELVKDFGQWQVFDPS